MGNDPYPSCDSCGIKNSEEIFLYATAYGHFTCNDCWEKAEGSAFDSSDQICQICGRHTSCSYETDWQCLACHNKKLQHLLEVAEGIAGTALTKNIALEKQVKMWKEIVAVMVGHSAEDAHDL